MIQRLIDADAFKKSVLTDFGEHYTQCHDTDQTSLMDMVMDNLDEQPTIDAVPVVRCRDCIKISPSVTEIKNAVWCRTFRAYIPCDGFCSYGERKDGDGNG